MKLRISQILTLIAVSSALALGIVRRLEIQTQLERYKVHVEVIEISPVLEKMIARTIFNEQVVIPSAEQALLFVSPEHVQGVDDSLAVWQAVGEICSEATLDFKVVYVQRHEGSIPEGVSLSSRALGDGNNFLIASVDEVLKNGISGTPVLLVTESSGRVVFKRPGAVREKDLAEIRASLSELRSF